MKPTEPILSTLMYLPPEYRQQVIDRFNEVAVDLDQARAEKEQLRAALARVCLSSSYLTANDLAQEALGWPSTSELRAMMSESEVSDE